MTSRARTCSACVRTVLLQHPSVLFVNLNVPLLARSRSALTHVTTPPCLYTNTTFIQLPTGSYVPTAANGPTHLNGSTSTCLHAPSCLHGYTATYLPPLHVYTAARQARATAMAMAPVVVAEVAAPFSLGASLPAAAS